MCLAHISCCLEFSFLYSNFSLLVAMKNVSIQIFVVCYASWALTDSDDGDNDDDDYDAKSLFFSMISIRAIEQENHGQIYFILWYDRMCFHILFTYVWIIKTINCVLWFFLVGQRLMKIVFLKFSAIFFYIKCINMYRDRQKHYLKWLYVLLWHYCGINNSIL